MQYEDIYSSSKDARNRQSAGEDTQQQMPLPGAAPPVKQAREPAAAPPAADSPTGETLSAPETPAAQAPASTPPPEMRDTGEPSKNPADAAQAEAVAQVADNAEEAEALAQVAASDAETETTAQIAAAQVAAADLTAIPPPAPAKLGEAPMESRFTRRAAQTAKPTEAPSPDMGAEAVASDFTAPQTKVSKVIPKRAEKILPDTPAAASKDSSGEPQETFVPDIAPTETVAEPSPPGPDLPGEPADMPLPMGKIRMEDYSLSNDAWGVPTVPSSPLIRFFRSFLPWKGDRPREILRKVLFLVFLAVFLTTAGILVSYYLDSRHNQQAASSLVAIYTSSPTPSSSSGTESQTPLPVGMQEKFRALYEQNQDIAGWITIPDTNINYPVVQTTDNDYYLKHTYEKVEEKHGTIFLDYQASLKPETNSMILYGHNMKDKSMFADVTKYRSLDFYKQVPLIDFNTIYVDYQYKVIGAYITNVSSSQDNGKVFDYLKLDLSSEAEFDAYVQEVQKRSLFLTGVDVNASDHLLSLSTCVWDFDDARMVLVARRVRPGESAQVDLSQARYNPKPYFPQAYYDAQGKPNPWR